MRTIQITDDVSGLCAFLVVHDTTLGPAAGGVRTWAYSSPDAAKRDAEALARAMTIKCALAGLAAGGGKAVVMDHPGLDRPRAFRRLGAAIEELGGLFRTAGDLGTTRADLEAMAQATQYVHTNDADLAAATGRGYLACVAACAELLGARVADLCVALQGCGATGEAAARAVARAGARVIVADIKSARAHRLARALGGATVASPAEILAWEADVVAPCATSGAITAAVAGAIRARAVCGTANNILATPQSEQLLMQRNVLLVPDVISSAGAVIEGIAAAIMGVTDRGPLLDGLGQTTRSILAEAVDTGRPATVVAEERARYRLATLST